MHNDKKFNTTKFHINKRFITLILIIISLISAGIAGFIAFRIANQNVSPGDTAANDPCGGCPSNHYCDTVTCPGTAFCCPNGTNCATNQYRQLYCPNNTTPTNNSNNNTPTNNPNNNTTPTNNPNNNTTPTNNPNNNTTPTNNPNNNTTPTNTNNNTNNSTGSLLNHTENTSTNNSSNTTTITQITRLPNTGMNGLNDLILFISISIITVTSIYILVIRRKIIDAILKDIYKILNNFTAPKIKKVFTNKKRKT